jgi:hypothetical protein
MTKELEVMDELGRCLSDACQTARDRAGHQSGGARTGGRIIREPETATSAGEQWHSHLG